MKNSENDRMFTLSETFFLVVYVSHFTFSRACVCVCVCAHMWTLFIGSTIFIQGDMEKMDRGTKKQMKETRDQPTDPIHFVWLVLLLFLLLFFFQKYYGLWKWNARTGSIELEQLSWYFLHSHAGCGINGKVSMEFRKQYERKTKQKRGKEEDEKMTKNYNSKIKHQKHRNKISKAKARARGVERGHNAIVCIVLCAVHVSVNLSMFFMSIIYHRPWMFQIITFSLLLFTFFPRFRPFFFRSSFWNVAVIWVH